MSDDFKNVIEELGKEIHDMREKADTYGKDSAEFKSYMEKADAGIKKLDDLVEEKNKEISVNNEKLKENEDRIKQLEKLVSMSGKNSSKAATPHDAMAAILSKSWSQFAENNLDIAKNYLDHLSKFSLQDVPQEGLKAKALGLQYKTDNNIVRSDINELGGWLCPAEWSTELDRIETEYSPVRNYARVMRIGAKQFHQPYIDQRPIAYFEGETKPVTASAPTIKNNMFTPYRVHVKIPFTKDIDMNNAYQFSQEIVDLAAFAIAEKEGLYFVKGDGVTKPSGFTTNATVIANALDSATSTLEFTDVIKMGGLLKTAYSRNAIYAMNRRTLNYLRLEKDSAERFIWNVDGNAAAAAPPTINGFRYTADFIDMDDYDVDDGYPIILADFNRFYRIIERTDVMMVINPYEALDEVTDMYNFFKWITGGVQLAEAGVLLKKIS